MLQKMRIETVEMLFSLMNEHFILNHQEERNG